jgi:cytochrome c biogenesis protein CcmG/thiol:disulfide interchange protein DsbE
LALLAALFAGYALRHDPHVNTSAMVGQPLPDLTLAPLPDGAPQRLRAVAGPATLINFYASWCAPCEQEHPALLALKAEGVRIVGVAYKDKPRPWSTPMAARGWSSGSPGCRRLFWSGRMAGSWPNTPGR